MAKKDRLLEIPMTAWWFEGLRIGLGQKRPYGVEKVVEPDAFRKVKSGYGHTNKWRVYKSGERHPRDGLIERAEKILPGSSSDLSHPIWKLGRLRADQTLSGSADEWLHQLNVGVLPLFFRIDPDCGKEVRRSASPRVLQTLVYRADLDGITALAILVRETAESRQYKLCMAAGDALYRALLHAAVRGKEQMQIVLPKIFAMLVDRVFPFARDRLYRYSFEGLDIPLFCQLFVAAAEAKLEALALRPGGIRPSDVDTVIFPGTVRPFGFLHFALPVRPHSPKGKFSEAEENFQAHINMWNRAITSMQSAPGHWVQTDVIRDSAST